MTEHNIHTRNRNKILRDLTGRWWLRSCKSNNVNGYPKRIVSMLWKEAFYTCFTIIVLYVHTNFDINLLSISMELLFDLHAISRIYFTTFQCVDLKKNKYFDFWCFNATFNNISAISWWPVHGTVIVLKWLCNWFWLICYSKNITFLKFSFLVLRRYATNIFCALKIKSSSPR
jgi:hypothetical protein